jgi:Zn finger protein HypA/HybF involved in hydrogenase expression
MKEIYIRSWIKKDITEVTRHLLIIDDLYGMCANCKQPGLNFVKDKQCPQCKTEFLYLAVRNKNEIAKILNRIEWEKLPYIVIEKEDWEKAVAKKSMDSLFQ